MHVFNGDNPSVLYLQAINEIMRDGKELSPRGKKIKEIRPATLEYTNPLRRVTFLRGRRFNPYFSIAESLWIISGHSDVAFLEKFNANMKSFSDDGVYFNASYGERLRYYMKNDLHHVIFNPVDQLKDVYHKIAEDHDTRQAVATITNPMFDNASYTIKQQGKDIACNLVIDFKVRDEKLDIAVFNRSNDVIWGTFTNLIQFSSIQEMMANWLGVGVGTYYHITNSLHTYLEDYGVSETGKVFEAHAGLEQGAMTDEQIASSKEASFFEFITEPRMSQNLEETDRFLQFFWSSVAPVIMDDAVFDSSEDVPMKLMNVILTDPEFSPLVDDYWRMAIAAMLAYRYKKMGHLDKCLNILSNYVADSSWKVSFLYFIKEAVQKSTDDKVQTIYTSILDKFKTTLINSEEQYELLKEYLR
jgi:thymidylate synthase